jgi:hypothetical protein
LPQRPKNQTLDEVRDFLRKRLPKSLAWTDAEKEARSELYEDCFPTELSRFGEVLARFIVAMVGALFVLVPIYIMAIDTSRTKNLVTTTVAVVLFAVVCSIALRTSNDQTLVATAAYAAVLVVFVGLTS